MNILAYLAGAIASRFVEQNRASEVRYPEAMIIGTRSRPRPIEKHHVVRRVEFPAGMTAGERGEVAARNFIEHWRG